MPNEQQELNDDMPSLVLQGKVYDSLKMVALILLPMFSTLYFGLGNIWGFPAIEQVIGSVAVFDTSLGTLLSISSKRYKNSDARFDGVMKPLVDGGGVNGFSMELKNSVGVEDLQTKDEVTFKVSPVEVT